MAVQKSRKSHAKSRMRRSHDALKVNIVWCEDHITGKLHRRHHVSEDGTYRGQHILDKEI